MTDKARWLLERALNGLNWYDEDLKEEIRDFLSTPEPTQDDVVIDLVQALEAMLVATTENGNEKFAGHHAAYLETVAKPRAKAALAKAKGEL